MTSQAEDFTRLLDYLKAARGFDFSGYKLSSWCGGCGFFSRTEEAERNAALLREMLSSFPAQDE